MTKQITLMTALALMTACGGGIGAATGISAPAAAAVPAPALPPGGKPAGWKLAWADEFDVDGLPDPGKWDYDTERNKAGWYNHELQYYARARLENSRDAGGK
jgi:hypothetical protein